MAHGRQVYCSMYIYIIHPTHSDRAALLDRLSNLEDESAAVKVSLIQLLQEKSATNKTLALENSRLNQRVSNYRLAAK